MLNFKELQNKKTIFTIWIFKKAHSHQKKKKKASSIEKLTPSHF